MLKMVVLAPTPRASVRTATIVNVGFLTSMRQTIANILKQSPHEDAPLGQYHGITERRISPLGAHQLGSFPFGPRFHSDFTFFRGPAQSPRRKFALFSRACWLLAVTINRSSRQRTRSSTAHQFCTLAKPRGLNGEPCR